MTGRDVHVHSHDCRIIRPEESELISRSAKRVIISKLTMKRSRIDRKMKKNGLLVFRMSRAQKVLLSLLPLTSPAVAVGRGPITEFEIVENIV